MGDQSLATRRVEAVLITGVYGSGKSSVAAEVAYLLEQRSEPYALLDLDYLSWAGTGSGGRAEEFGRMLANLTAVASNYRQAGIALFVLAYFVRDHAEARLVEEALGVPLTVVSLTVPLPEIKRRLLADVTSGRRDDLQAAAVAIAAAQGAGVAEVTIANDRPIGVVARELMAVLGWGDPAGRSGSWRSGGTA
jgi:energy-coupling factor transporter ATP-binding protein EcfA2